MITYLLDADWIIDYLSGQADALHLYPSLERDGMALSVITRVELRTGIGGSRDPVRAVRELRQFLRVVMVLPLDQAVERRLVHIRRDLLDRRRPIKHRAYDLIVAATAVAHDLTLITGNTRDYADIPGLRLMNPRSP